MSNFAQRYQPDILECLADLSNDEVFTPPKIANLMLDLLPQEIWKNPDIKILDPATKSGVFLREAAKRLLEAQIPNYKQILEIINNKKSKAEKLTKAEEDFLKNLQNKINHIFTKQLYGFPITELTALLSRRSVYCAVRANSQYSVISNFNDEQGNIRFFEKISHEFEDKTNKCKFCGASKNSLDRGEGKEKHAYSFLHYQQLLKLWENLKNMKFNVIIGNPPYQLADGGAQASAKPIYNLFVEQAKKLNPDYLIMITPARFFTGGKGLDDYRKSFITDKRIRVLHDYADAGEIFKGVDVKGGVCYFLWDKNYQAEADIYRHNFEGITHSKRYLCEKGDDIFIREYTLLSVKKKVLKLKEPTMDLITSPAKAYGLRGEVIKNPEKYKLPPMLDNPLEGGYKILGLSGSQKRIYKYLPQNYPFTHDKALHKYKVFISESYGCGEIGDIPSTPVLATPVLATPEELCTETFIQIGCFDTENEAQNLLSYIKTKFFRALVGIRKQTQHATKTVYSFVPQQDFSKSWTDEELYKKYGLDEEEIAFIERMIKPME